MLSMMSGYRTLLPLVALALLVGFGSAAAETAGKAELPPGEWRTFKVGDKWVWQNQDGREYNRSEPPASGSGRSPADARPAPNARAQTGTTSGRWAPWPVRNGRAFDSRTF